MHAWNHRSTEIAEEFVEDAQQPTSDATGDFGSPGQGVLHCHPPIRMHDYQSSHYPIHPSPSPMRSDMMPARPRFLLPSNHQEQWKVT